MIVRLILHASSFPQIFFYLLDLGLLCAPQFSFFDLNPLNLLQEILHHYEYFQKQVVLNYSYNKVT